MMMKLEEHKKIPHRMNGTGFKIFWRLQFLLVRTNGLLDELEVEFFFV